MHMVPTASGVRVAATSRQCPSQCRRSHSRMRRPPSRLGRSWSRTPWTSRGTSELFCAILTSPCFSLERQDGRQCALIASFAPKRVRSLLLQIHCGGHHTRLRRMEQFCRFISDARCRAAHPHHLPSFPATHTRVCLFRRLCACLLESHFQMVSALCPIWIWGAFESATVLLRQCSERSCNRIQTQLLV